MAINGSIHVILNNKQNTVMFEPTGADRTSNMKTKDEKGKRVKKTNSAVVQDFTYLTLKKRGKPMTSEDKVMKQLYYWVVNNIPDGEFKKAIEN
jgi:hypothetical protein